MIVVTDPKVELSRESAARIRLHPAPTAAEDLPLRLVPPSLPSSGRAAWRLPTVEAHWSPKQNLAILSLRRGDYVLLGSSFGQPIGHVTLLGDGEYWIDR